MTRPRASQHLGAPPSPDQLRGRFPGIAVRAGTALYRTHSAKLDPWWFGSSLDNRFDLSGPAGTCYTAESEIVGLLEAWAGIRFIARADVAARAISTLTVDRDLLIADLTSNAGIRFGLTAEISTTIDYPLSQQWAANLRAAGFDGLRYWARHELSHTHTCVALFDAAGDQTDSVLRPSVYRVARTESLIERGDLLDELNRHAGITIMAPPPSLDPS
ncbi:RES family NAD+ phosphorylase [Rhodococcus marinonascens]|uniref:RES family NAD+ phosphorylase n=1 Tax=Rhodococcus marinonascens TaxID=38311 RepID=UPI000B2E73C1|nr:RES family NAD+ phosphorylase [Rhodococcus marinonascens]